MVDGDESQSNSWFSETRLELITAILLGMAALATAWAAFQGSQYDGQMLTSFTEANLSLSDANAYYSEGDQIFLQDEMLFLEYERAVYDGDTEFAQHLKDTLMSDQLIAAIEWWELPENQDFYSPFVDENPNYVLDSYIQADELSEATDESFQAGQAANNTGDKYNLITVLLAASLFVLGIATGFRIVTMRLAIIGIGAAIFLGSTIWMLTLPSA
jgi:hypothetical protein